jgi:hypothetical protein
VDGPLRYANICRGGDHKIFFLLAEIHLDDGAEFSYIRWIATENYIPGQIRDYEDYISNACRESFKSSQGQGSDQQFRSGTLRTLDHTQVQKQNV